jgi:hypothetical protein
MAQQMYHLLCCPQVCEDSMITYPTRRCSPVVRLRWDHRWRIVRSRWDLLVARCLVAHHPFYLLSIKIMVFICEIDLILSRFFNSHPKYLMIKTSTIIKSG